MEMRYEREQHPVADELNPRACTAILLLSSILLKLNDIAKSFIHHLTIYHRVHIFIFFIARERLTMMMMIYAD